MYSDQVATVYSGIITQIQHCLNIHAVYKDTQTLTNAKLIEKMIKYT